MKFNTKDIKSDATGIKSGSTKILITASSAAEFIVYLNETIKKISSLTNALISTNTLLSAQDFTQEKKLDFRILGEYGSDAILDRSFELILNDKKELILVTIIGSIKLTTLDSKEIFHKICTDYLKSFNLQKINNIYIARTDVNSMSLPDRANKITDPKIISATSKITQSIFSGEDFRISLHKAQQNAVIKKYNQNIEKSVTDPEKVVESEQVNNIQKFVVSGASSGVNCSADPLNKNTIICMVSKGDSEISKTSWYYNPQYIIPVTFVIAAVGVSVVNNFYKPRKDGQTALLTAALKKMNELLRLDSSSSDDNERTERAGSSDDNKRTERAGDNGFGGDGDNGFGGDGDNGFGGDGDNGFGGDGDNGFDGGNSPVFSSLGYSLRSGASPVGISSTAMQRGQATGGLLGRILNNDGNIIPRDIITSYVDKKRGTYTASGEDVITIQDVYDIIGRGSHHVMDNSINHDFGELFKYNEFREILKDLNKLMTGDVRGEFYKRVVTKDEFRLKPETIQKIIDIVHSNNNNNKHLKTYIVFLLVMAEEILTGVKADDNLYQNNQEIIKRDELFDDAMKKCSAKTEGSDEEGENSTSLTEDSCFEVLMKEMVEKEKNIVNINFVNPKTNKAISVEIDINLYKCVDLHIDGEYFTFGIEGADSDEISMTNLTGKVFDELDEFDYICLDVVIN